MYLLGRYKSSARSTQNSQIWKRVEAIIVCLTLEKLLFLFKSAIQVEPVCLLSLPVLIPINWHFTNSHLVKINTFHPCFFLMFYLQHADKASNSHYKVLRLPILTSVSSQIFFLFFLYVLKSSSLRASSPWAHTPAMPHWIVKRVSKLLGRMSGACRLFN